MEELPQENLSAILEIGKTIKEGYTKLRTETLWTTSGGKTIFSCDEARSIISSLPSHYLPLGNLTHSSRNAWGVDEAQANSHRCYCLTYITVSYDSTGHKANKVLKLYADQELQYFRIYITGLTHESWLLQNTRGRKRAYEFQLAMQGNEAAWEPVRSAALHMRRINPTTQRVGIRLITSSAKPSELILRDRRSTVNGIVSKTPGIWTIALGDELPHGHV